MQQTELRKQAKQFALDRAKTQAETGRVVVECEQGHFTESDDGSPQRYQTRVAVRRRFAEIKLTLEAETGQLLIWIVPERYIGATETTIDLEQAKQLASEAVEIPDDAEIAEILQGNQPDSYITTLTWRHTVNGLEVENDSVTVQINSKTREIICLAKIWNDVMDRDVRISEKDAEEIARQEAPEYAETDDFNIDILEQKFIPIVIDNDTAQRRIRIAKVWVATITRPGIVLPKVTALSIDCVTGEIVRVQHSK